MLKDKYFYVVTILWIAIVALGFNLYFDETSATEVPVVIALIGTALGWITVVVLRNLGVIESKDKK